MNCEAHNVIHSRRSIGRPLNGGVAARAEKAKAAPTQHHEKRRTSTESGTGETERVPRGDPSGEPPQTSLRPPWERAWTRFTWPDPRGDGAELIASGSKALASEPSTSRTRGAGRRVSALVLLEAAISLRRTPLVEPPSLLEAAPRSARSAPPVDRTARAGSSFLLAAWLSSRLLEDIDQTDPAG